MDVLMLANPLSKHPSGFEEYLLNLIAFTPQ